MERITSISHTENDDVVVKPEDFDLFRDLFIKDKNDLDATHGPGENGEHLLAEILKMEIEQDCPVKHFVDSE